MFNLTKNSTLTKPFYVPKKKTSSKEPKINIKTPPLVFQETQKELDNLSKLLGCPVMSYFKPPTGNIWGQDLYGILEALKTIGHTEKLALYIRSNGGQGMVSLRIINLLRSFTDNLILLAPSECASAATMLALGCDEIHMGPLSSLSPVDSSLTHPLSPTDSLNNKIPVSLDELWRVLKLWKEAEKEEFKPEDKVTKSQKEEPLLGFTKKSKDKSKIESESENPYKYLYEYIHPMVFGAVDRYSSLSVRICKEILSYHLDDEDKVAEITRHLNYDYPAHSYPITFREAEKIGLPVKKLEGEVLDSLNRLQLLYSELTEEQITDYDNSTYHDNSIYSVIETNQLQLEYRQNYDKFYRDQEKRYIILNDYSGWYKNSFVPGKTKRSKATVKTEKVFF
jgi:hypothetical protein